MSNSFEKNILENWSDYKSATKAPFWGSRGELKELKKNLYNKRVTGENIQKGAEFLSKLYGIENIDFLMGLIRQKGSVEDVILAEKKGELNELRKLMQKESKHLNDYPKASAYQGSYQHPYMQHIAWPQSYTRNVYQRPQARSSYDEKHDKILNLLESLNRERQAVRSPADVTLRVAPVRRSNQFLSQVIGDTYEPDTAIYKKRDDVSSLLSDYVKLSKAYKLKTNEIRNRLQKLTHTISHTTRVPSHEIEPFVKMTIPMIERQSNFY